MNIEINEIIAEDNINVRSSHKWNTEKIQEFATELNNDYSGKIVRVSIDTFYNEMYTNPEHKIKHLSYYCKQKLQKAFKTLEIDAKVGTTKKWDGVLVIQL